MPIDWTEIAWLEWSAPQQGDAGPQPFVRVDSVRPEPLAKIVRLMLRWDMTTRQSFRIVTQRGRALDAATLEEVVRDGRFPLPLPVTPAKAPPLQPKG